MEKIDYKKINLSTAALLDTKEEQQWILDNYKNNRLPIDRPMFYKHYRQWILENLDKEIK